MLKNRYLMHKTGSASSIKNSENIMNFSDIRQNLERLTCNNEHTEARIYLCTSLLPGSILLDIYKGIELIQYAEQCLPHELVSYRHQVDQRLYEELISTFGEDEAIEIYRTL